MEKSGHISVLKFNFALLRLEDARPPERMGEDEDEDWGRSGGGGN